MSISAQHRPGLSLVLLPFLGILGCSLPPIELDPTPAPVPVSEGDYRFTQFEVPPGTIGRDFDQNGSVDNHFPALLDLTYSTLEAAIVPLLEEQLGDQSELAWQVISQAMLYSGLPVSAAAYNQAMLDAIRLGELNFLARLSADGSQVRMQLFQGTASPGGYVPGDAPLGQLQGAAGTPSQLGPGSFYVLYPQAWFILELLVADARLEWTNQSLSEGLSTGLFLERDIIAALLLLVPDTIEVGTEVYEVPEELIALELAALLEAQTLEDGTPLFDQTLEGLNAISAAFLFSGAPVLLVE